MEGDYKSCAIGMDGACTRWSHDHGDDLKAQPGVPEQVAEYELVVTVRVRGDHLAWDAASALAVALGTSDLRNAGEVEVLAARPAEARSTPAEFGDCAVVVDRRGKAWKYSEPGDVWSLIDDHMGPGSVAPWSARSYQALVAEFGPLETPRR
jgi:hypothetical protein